MLIRKLNSGLIYDTYHRAFGFPFDRSPRELHLAGYEYDSSHAFHDLTTLERVYVFQTDLPSGLLEQIASIPSLKELHLSASRTDPEVISRIQTDHPELLIFQE